MSIAEGNLGGEKAGPAEPFTEMILKSVEQGTRVAGCVPEAEEGAKVLDSIGAVKSRLNETWDSRRRERSRGRECSRGRHGEQDQERPEELQVPESRSRDAHG